MSVLPTMKTPAFQKHRSRVEQVEEAADNVGDPVSQPLGLNQVSKPATDVSLISGDTIETTDPGMVDVTNTVRKSTRSRAKKKSVPSKENAHESFPAVPATTNPKRTTRACARKRVTKEVVADDLEAVPATATRRTTRTRTKKAETGSGGQGGEDSCLVDTVATSSRRMTRSRINSAASVESQTGGEKEKPVMASKLPVACRDPQNGDSPMSTQSVGPDRNQVPIECSSPSVTQSKQKVSDDIPDLANLPPHTEEPTGKGLSQNGSAKTLDLVTAEKLQVSSPAIETSIQLMETEETTTAGQTLLPVPVASDVAPPVRRSTRLFKGLLERQTHRAHRTRMTKGISGHRPEAIASEAKEEERQGRQSERQESPEESGGRCGENRCAIPDFFRRECDCSCRSWPKSRQRPCRQRRRERLNTSY